MKPINPVFLIIWLIGSPLAALCAFLITYNEYAHHYSGRKEPLKIAIEAAVFTFIAFVILGVLADFMISQSI